MADITGSEAAGASGPDRRLRRALAALLVSGALLAQAAVVSAHGGGDHGPLARWHGLAVLLAGVAVVAGAVVARRTDRLSPTAALAGVFVGVSLAALGAVLFDGLSPDPAYTASSMPFPRSWYAPLALGVGSLIMVASLAVGVLRWPTRPRYAFLGILLGLWVVYPKLVPQSHGHPLGYLIVLSTPLLVGYVVWRDARDVLAAALRDPVARRFGVGIGLVVALFFATSTGYLSVFWEEGAPTETTVAVLPVVYQLVTWPTLEVALPQIPLSLALSPGLVVLNGLIGALVGLNAAVVARQWRVRERAGLTEGTAGTAAIVGSCTCGCCGPLVAKFTVAAAGPALAAPVYWLFVDTASPLGVLFVVGSVVLFTATLVYSAGTARRGSEAVCAASAGS